MSIGDADNKWSTLQLIFPHRLRRREASFIEAFHLKEGVFQRVVQFHDGRLVAAAITIVGGRENRDHVPEEDEKLALNHFVNLIRTIIV